MRGFEIVLFAILVATAFLVIVAAIVVTTVVVIASAVIVGIRIKFIYGELHFTENRAGIVVIAGLGILFGQTEMASREHKLNSAFHTNDRKYADGNVDVICTHFIDKIAVEAVADKLGNCVDTHTTMSERLVALDNLAVETDGRSNLDNYRRKSGLAVTAEIALVEAEAVVFGVGSKYRHVLFTAVENDFFIECGEPLDLLYSACAEACFKRYAEIVANCNLITAFVEGDGLDVDIGIDHLYAFTSYCSSTVDNLLTCIAKVHANILEAILISCGIEHLVDADTAKLFFIIAAKIA